ncbi:hypothetical protein Tco_0344892 [Tanacetum coccineum]
MEINFKMNFARHAILELEIHLLMIQIRILLTILKIFPTTPHTMNQSCGNGAHYGFNCPPKVPTISNLEPCHNQNIDEFPRTLPSFHPTCYSGDENSFTYDSNLDFVDDSPNPPPQPPTYSCEFCGNDAHYGYDCPPQVPFIYNPEPCYNQDFNFPQNLQSFQQQYICCTRCGGPHETFQCQQLIFDEPYCENCRGPHMSFQCQPMNQNYYESNPCYDSNSFGFDQIQPPQYSIDRSIIESLQSMFEEFRKRQPAANIDQLPPQEMSIQDMEDLKQQYLDEMKSLINEVQIKDYRNEKIDIQYRRECEIKIDELKQNFNGMSIEIRKKEKELMQQEQAAYVRTSQRFNFIDDDDDEYSFATQEYLKKFSFAITPDLPKSDSLIMEDKHLYTILAITPYPNPIESVLNRDNVISSPKIDLLIEEFAGELALIAPIPPGIIEADLDPKGDIFFIENLIDDDSYEDSDDIDYVEASPPDSELVSLEIEALKSDSLGSDLAVSFPSGTRNKIFDPGIFIEVQSKKFLSQDEFSISFIRDPLSPVIDTLLLFLFENEDNVFNLGILASNEEKSPHLLSHRDFKAFHLISESPMMIYGGNIPILDVPFLHFYPP